MKLIEELPRAAVDTHLQLARLPLTAFEAVARRGMDNDEWAPALAFEGYEARVKELVGGIVNDDELLSSARLTRAKLAQLGRAAEKDAAAEAKAAQAEEQRRRVERQAAEREAKLEREKAAARQKVEREFAQREQASNRIEATQKKAVAKRETAAERTRLKAEADALAQKERAVGAKAQAVTLDKAVQTTKARRRNGA
jgi:hypothetical protein